jgi:hypothetical protein
MCIVAAMTQNIVREPMTREESLILARAARTRRRLENAAWELVAHGFCVYTPEGQPMERKEEN